MKFDEVILFNELKDKIVFYLRENNTIASHIDLYYALTFDHTSYDINLAFDQLEKDNIIETYLGTNKRLITNETQT